MFTELLFVEVFARCGVPSSDSSETSRSSIKLIPREINGGSSSFGVPWLDLTFGGGKNALVVCSIFGMTGFIFIFGILLLVGLLVGYLELGVFSFLTFD